MYNKFMGGTDATRSEDSTPRKETQSSGAIHFQRKQARYECKGCGFAFHDKCFRQWHDEYVTDLEVV